ncbi:MAG: hypothetical protein MZU84_04870 [Sphingobacterium sp.]|nr:hypothetical protein [Sphingobacterium sp.]
MFSRWEFSSARLRSAAPEARRFRLRRPAVRRAVHAVRPGAVLVGRPGARRRVARAPQGPRGVVEPGHAARRRALREARATSCAS